MQLDDIREQNRRLQKRDGLYHMIFAGPPGTGKTSMASLVAKLMTKMRLVKSPKVVFVNNSLELIAAYSGQTAGKVDAKVEDAKGTQISTVMRRITCYDKIKFTLAFEMLGFYFVFIFISQCRIYLFLKLSYLLYLILFCVHFAFLCCDIHLGGVLFIDEAYSIVKKDSSNDTFGREAIDTIMKHLDPPACVFIFAGYTEVRTQCKTKTQLCYHCFILSCV